VLGVHPVVVTIAVLAVDRPSSETRDAGGDDGDGKRPEVALTATATAVRNAAAAAAVMTFPGKAVTFI
jgi:hypothetical protein